jgi:predicted RNase H-like nuclease (RuvC/YqgF family)
MDDMLKAIKIKNREQIDKITELTNKCNELRKYEGECYQLKLDLKHYKEMKKEMEMKNNQIETIQQELMSIKKNIMKVIEEIKVEISENPRSANIGKKGCMRRLYNILD